MHIENNIQVLKNINEVFAYNLRRLRGKRSQAKMAEIAGVPMRTYQNMEEGNIPHRPNLEAIAKAHGVEEPDLFSDPNLAPKPGVDDALKMIQERMDELDRIKSSPQYYLAQALSALDEEKAAKYLELIALQNPATPALKDLFLSFSKRPDRAKKSSNG